MCLDKVFTHISFTFQLMSFINTSCRERGQGARKVNFNGSADCSLHRMPVATKIYEHLSKINLKLMNIIIKLPAIVIVIALKRLYSGQQDQNNQWEGEVRKNSKHSENLVQLDNGVKVNIILFAIFHLSPAV